MSRRDLDAAIAHSRNGNVTAALERLEPKRKRSPAAGKSRQGQLADQAGKAFQADVRQSLELEAKSGRCVFTEGNPRVGGYPGAMFPIEPSTVDFQLLASGIPIAFDCKVFHDQAEFSVRNVAGGEKAIRKLERQIRYLLDFRKQGGISFLFLHEVKRGRAWLCFSLQTLLDGGSVAVRTLEREQRGIPARAIDHLPAIEPDPRLIGPRWLVLDAALRHGRKTLPIESPFREGVAE